MKPLLDEKELLQRVAHGDQHAFKILYEQFNENEEAIILNDITGSTRMKCGTAQKMLFDMISVVRYDFNYSNDQDWTG